MNTVESVDRFCQNIVNGKWDQVSMLSLPSQLIRSTLYLHVRLCVLKFSVGASRDVFVVPSVRVFVCVCIEIQVAPCRAQIGSGSHRESQASNSQVGRSVRADCARNGRTQGLLLANVHIYRETDRQHTQIISAYVALFAAVVIQATRVLWSCFI